MSRDTSNSKILRTRRKTSGWTLFDQKHRQKQGILCESDMDPYPPIPSVAFDATRYLERESHTQLKSFSSVVKSSNSTVMNHSNNGVSTHNPKNNSECQMDKPISEVSVCERLKKMHIWAEHDLIQDVLVAVNGNEEEASTLLNTMMSSTYNQMEVSSTEWSSDTLVYPDDKKSDLTDLGNTQDIQTDKYELPNFVNLYSIPMEPDWEEDDIYLIHRKDAIKSMRSASQHARAANNAFLRGDHLSAKHHSLKACEERLKADKLNSEAAKKILSIRNSKNNVWVLDLHGLHASEAVHVLEEHLNKLESQNFINGSNSLDERIGNDTKIEYSLAQTGQSLNMDMIVEKPLLSSIPRQGVLEVITGIGTHSRGQAALPPAVRCFLIDKGYRFDDVRPGVFYVRPKFRLK